MKKHPTLCGQQAGMRGAPKMACGRACWQSVITLPLTCTTLIPVGSRKDSVTAATNSRPDDKLAATRPKTATTPRTKLQRPKNFIELTPRGIAQNLRLFLVTLTVIVQVLCRMSAHATTPNDLKIKVRTSQKCQRNTRREQILPGEVQPTLH